MSTRLDPVGDEGLSSIDGQEYENIPSNGGHAFGYDVVKCAPVGRSATSGFDQAMQSNSSPLWRTTSMRPLAYWFTGALLIWLFLPVSLLDMLIAPEWYAPNPQCDSFGIPIMETGMAALPWAAAAALISAVATFSCASKRKGSTDVFALNFTRSLRWWVFTLFAGAIIATLLLEIAAFVLNAVVPQTVIADCGGTADPVALVTRGPTLQVGPLLNVLMILWLLHLRALAVSSRI